MVESREKNTLTKSQKLKALLALCVSLTLVIVVGVVSLTYSWIFATYFSDINGINIELTESQGLVMFLDGNVTQSININTYLGETFSTFSLKEVSSSNGRDMFLRDAASYYLDESHLYDSIDVAKDGTGIIKFREAISADNNNSFLYFDFQIEAGGDNRYIIFDAVNSFIENDNVLVNPIRVSLTFIEGENIVTKIIGNRQEYFGNYYTDAVYSTDSTTKVGYTSDQAVSSFEGYTGYENSVFNADNTLYYLQQGVQIEMVVRIWLEGGDPQCSDDIAGSSLDIALRFDNIAESEVI